MTDENQTRGNDVRCDPHHGMTPTIRSVACLPKILEDYRDKEHAHIRYWFRGQANADPTWKLVPGVYRRGFIPDDAAKTARLEKERRLYQDFSVWSAGLRTGRESEAEIYFLQQHYRMPTRLLDWSNNALAALYFAVSEHPDKCAKFFMMDALKLGRQQNAKYRPPHRKAETDPIDFRGIAPSGHPVFRRAVRRIAWWQDRFEFPDFIIPVRPDYHDRRISLQRSCFTFHVPGREELTTNENNTLKEFIIPQCCKEKIRQELALLGIDAFAVYGDMERLADTLKLAHGVG